jgi:hypothetical protein
MNEVAEGKLLEKEKAQARGLAPKFTSISRIASPESNYDMLFRFILCVESMTWLELGAPGGLTRFLGISADVQKRTRRGMRTDETFPDFSAPYGRIWFFWVSNAEP